MKKIVLFCLFFCLPKLMAQQANVATGGNAFGPNGSSTYSVGQVAYLNIIGTDGTVNQGVQQPFEIFTLGTDAFPEITLTMTLYPNPTTAWVNLLIPNYTSEFLNYQLFDLNGRALQAQKISEKETRISMDNLATATYLLSVSGNNKLLKTFKIIKN